MNRVCVVGIAGGSACGKTTIVNRIKENFGDDIVVISHDSYYKAHDEQNLCNEGDTVRIIEAKPSSKDKRWSVAEVLEKAK